MTGDSSAAEETRPMDVRARQSGVRRDGRVGRYLVLQELGRGGMGEVFLAFDPELDRKVAVKLLRRLRKADPKREQALAMRMVREAQALAKLQHPNVVSVHDVGTVDGRVFIAMEYIEGSTLTAWASGNRPWQDVVHVMLEAGRGLAAAHEAGLIHRDFKPGNVMLGLSLDGRPRRVVVLDFGLATEVDEPTAAGAIESVASVLDDDSMHRTGGTKLTRTGARLGTPAYMAPEQHLGHSVTHASDQFGFCASMFEALYGLRPFEGNSEDVGERIARGEMRAFPKDRDVPSSVRRILERGMSPEPRERFPSMNALLKALEITVAPRSNRVLIAGASVALVALGGYQLAAASASEQAPASVCRDSKERLSDVWNEEARATVTREFSSSVPLLGESSAVRVIAMVDGYAERWTAAHREACEATHVHHEQSDEMLDRRMACLEQGRRRLSGLVAVFAQADRTVVRQGVEAASSLPSVASCSDRARLLGVAAPPQGADLERISRIEAAMADAQARTDAGLYAEAEAKLQTLVGEAEAAGFRPLAARVRLALGQAQSRAGDYDGAVENLEAAYFEARRENDPETVARAGIALAFVVGQRQAKPEAGLTWARHGDVELEKLQDPRLHSMADLGRGAVLATAGRLDEARQHLERALETAAADGNGALDAAGVLTSLTGVALAQGRAEEAEDFARRALEIQRDALGPEHPEVAKTLASLGNVLSRSGRLADARKAHEDALKIQERVLGREHSEVAATLNNLGLTAMLQYDFEVALEHHQRALEIRESALGPNHPHVAGSHASLGEIELSMKRHDRAIAHFERARDIWTEALGADHRATALALHHLGATLHQAGRPAEGIEPLERSLSIRQNTDGDPGEVAEAKFDLAQALWAAGEQRERARLLAQQARDGFDPKLAPSYVERIETWLSTHN